MTDTTDVTDMTDNPFEVREAKRRADKRIRCNLCRQVLESLSDDQIEMFADAMRRTIGPNRIEVVTISDVLEVWGIETSDTVVSSHRAPFGKSLKADCVARVESGWSRS